MFTPYRMSGRADLPDPSNIDGLSVRLEGVGHGFKQPHPQADGDYVGRSPLAGSSVSDRLVAAPLLVMEDDEAHAVLIERVLRKAGVANPLVITGTGQQTLSALSASEEGRSALPVLVLLDLHVPGASGLDILEWIRDRPALEHLPVVMLSSSTESDDINRAFELGADSYLVKPVGFGALADTVGSLGLQWAIVGRPSETSVSKAGE
jgi:CheY-like chemotaxis protein